MMRDAAGPATGRSAGDPSRGRMARGARRMSPWRRAGRAPAFRSLALAAAFALASGPASGPAQAIAQEPGPPPDRLEELRGERVRVAIPNVPARTVVGRLEGVTRDALVVRPRRGAPAETIPLSSIGRLEMSSGFRSHAGRGAALGGLVGGAFGLALGAAAGDACWGCTGKEVASGTALLSLLTAGVGAGLGALVGAGARSERWVEVPVARLDLGLVPVLPVPRPAGGVGVLVRLRP